MSGDVWYLEFRQNIKMKNDITAVLLLLCFIGCQNPLDSKIIGKWQAYALELGDTILTDHLEEVHFQFWKDGTYAYESTLNYKEAGQFELQNGLLRTTDTLNDKEAKKTVQIISATNDTLAIRMNNNGEKQLLKLYKLKRDSI